MNVCNYKFNRVKMECIVANVDHMRFDIEIALDEQYGALSLPFTGMDSTYFLKYRLYSQILFIIYYINLFIIYKI